MKFFTHLILLAVISVLPMQAFAETLEAHVHGVATLQVAVDAKTLTLNFSSPLDSLLGFERKARNQAEVAQVQAMIKQFYKANLFVPTKAAQCALKSIHLKSIVIKSNSAVEHENAEEGHADLDGEFIFTCKKAENLRDLQVSLFKAFPNMHQLNAEVVSARGQTAVKLNTENTRLAW